jgi:hypothetical protein
MRWARWVERMMYRHLTSAGSPPSNGAVRVQVGRAVGEHHRGLLDHMAGVYGRGCGRHGLLLRGACAYGLELAQPRFDGGMTGIFRPHLGDAGRAISFAAAGVCLLGLAFGDPGKFLQAGGHVLV